MGLLSDTSADLRETAGRLDQAIAAGDDEQIEEILSGSSNRLSSFFASPVELDTKRFYPIANYGSAMAPFYSVLAIWVGGIILVAMLKVQVEKSRYETLYYVKDYQLYLGRYGLFFLLGFMQSSLLGLGDLYFLGIQCEHPFYFMITCWFTSIVFVNIIYTLTVSFGDIGKAICVILLVMQVAGSGGTFPIEMTPRFFHQIYNFLPFTHSMNAMRECIAGFYEDMYWVELGILAIYFILSLLLGAIFRLW